MVTLSICCVTFNHSSYIEKCIEGFLNQETDFEFEILIFDDASKDNNQEILQNFAQKNKSIKLFLQNENQWSKGKFGLLTHLFPAVKGKYIAFCEGDDFWEDPHKLQRQVDFLEKNDGYVISFHEVEKIDSYGQSMNQKVLGEVRHKDLSKEELIKGELVPTVSAVIRADLIKDFPEVPENLVNGDTFLFAILGQFGKAHFHDDIQPAKYRIHGGGVWTGSDLKSKIESQVQTFETLEKTLKPEFIHLVNRSLLDKYLIRLTKHSYPKTEKIRQYFLLWKFAISTGQTLELIRLHKISLTNKSKFKHG